MYKQIILINFLFVVTTVSNGDNIPIKNQNNLAPIGKKISIDNIVNNNSKRNKDHILSANGPLISDDEIQLLQLQKSYLTNNYQLIKNTYTYVRCYYKKDAENPNIDNKNVSTNYVWALDDDNNYFIISGNWTPYAVNNVDDKFYTNISLDKIKSTCDRTIRNNNLGINSFYQVAADNKYSLNHIIYSNNIKKNIALNLSNIITFGDSLSDINNTYNFTEWKTPNSDSWFAGRFTNGFTWSEYLSKELNIPLYNFAYGGAASIDQTFCWPVKTPVTCWNLPGIVTQINNWVVFKDYADNYSPKTSLFTILIGANDFISPDITKRSSASDVLMYVNNALDILVSNNAKHIIVFNLPDLTKAPAFAKYGRDISGVKSNIDSYNNGIIRIVNTIKYNHPEIDIQVLSLNSIFENMLNNPSKYNFSNVQDTCLQVDNDDGDMFSSKQQLRSSCINTSQFIFWDIIHPTTAAHKVIESEILKVLNAN